MYAKDVREPTDAEMGLIDVATRIAGIAIERKLAEDRIHFMANHDALTGLPNRTLLNDRCRKPYCYAQRYDRWVTVLFVDLDNFKFINDSLGHNAGDELLKTIAKRMVDCVRATDTVVRLGGDEFVVVLSDQPKNADTISEIVQKIQAAIAEPVRLEGHDLRVTSSVGDCELSRRRHRRRHAAGQRRRGDVPRQGSRSRQYPILHARDEHQGPREVPAAGRIAKRARPIRVRPPLSAASRFAHRARIRGRSLDSVEPSEAGPDPADQIHSAGRGNRPDRADRRLGVARSLSAEQGLAECRPASHGGERQRVGAAIQRKGLGQPRRPRAEGERVGGQIPRARAD